MVIDVVGTTTTSQTFTTGDLAALEDLDHPPYQVRSVPGGSVQDEPRPDRAVSIQRLLTSVSLPGGGTLPWQSVSFAEVIDRNGGSHPLDNTALGDAGSNGFADGLMPGVFVVGNNDAIAYIRPLRPDPQDVNGADFFQTLSHGALQIVAHTSGSLLSATVQAAKTQLAVGEVNSFTVALAPQPGGQVDYAWNFGDGTTGTGANPQHTWAAAGTYYVSVTVHAADGSYGQSASVAIQVGPAPTPSATASSPGGSGGGSPTALPTGPNSGTGSPTPQGSPKPTKKPTKKPTPGQSGSPTGTVTGSPSSTATSSGTPSSLPSTSPTASHTSSPSHSPTPTPTPSPSASDTPDVGTDDLEAVSGTLIAADAALIVPVQPVQPATQEPRAARPHDVPDRQLAWWAGLLPLLLLAGALGEWAPLHRGGPADRHPANDEADQ